MSPTKMYNQASELQFYDRLSEARDIFQQIVSRKVSKHNPSRLKAGAYFHLGQICLEEFDKKEATRMFRQCLRFFPQHQRARLLLETLTTKNRSLELFQQLTTVGENYGWNRGRPIDRYYIEAFLKTHKSCVRGNVLEVQDNIYTRKFGQARVTGSDILDIDRSNSKATLIGDLSQPGMFKENSYDCIIITQTIHVIFDIDAVFCSLKRMIKPGGYILATFPSVSRIDGGAGHENDCWRFTHASTKQLFHKHFPDSEISIHSYGNVAVCAAFLYALSIEDLDKEQLEKNDPNFPLIIGAAVTAKK